MRATFPGLVVSAAVVLAAFSCSTAGRREQVLDRVENADLDRTQLRNRVLAYQLRFSEQVESTADQIAAACPDPEIRRRTLRWKANAIAAAQVATGSADPVIALLDVWTLTAQMRAFFEAGAGSELFGPQQSVAVAASRELEAEVAGVATQLSATGAAPVGEGIKEIIADHPLRDLTFSRWGDGKLSALARDGEHDVFSAVATMEDRVSLVSASLPLYARVMPKQARWNAELLLDDLLANNVIGRARDDLSQIADNLEHISDFVETATVMITEQREAAIRDVAQAIDTQRIAINKSLNLQREEVLRALSEERSIVLASVDEQRRHTIAEFERLLDKVMTAVPAQTETAIDQFWWRFVQIEVVLLLLGGGALVALMVLWSHQKRRSSHPS